MPPETPSQQDLFLREHSTPGIPPDSKKETTESKKFSSSGTPVEKAEIQTIDIVPDTGQAATENPAPRIDTSRLAPMLRQYVEIKEQYPSCLLLFQVGDFFEVFFDDAVTVSDALSIRLTSRDKDQDNPIPMCGVPVHAFENYLPRLLRQGFSCVVVEQVEDAAQAKGLVKREITRIITPGVRLDGEGLDEKHSNYLSAILPYGIDSAVFVAIEVSTGILLLREAGSADEIEDLLYRYAPKEILLPFKDIEAGILETAPALVAALEYAKSAQVKISYRKFSLQQTASATPSGLFEGYAIEETVSKEITKDLDAGSPALKRAVRTLLSYVRDISLHANVCISAYSFEKVAGCFVVDNATRRNLELGEASFDGDRKHSVLGVLDRTKTAAGGRVLQDWLMSPLASKEKIDARLDAISEILREPDTMDEIRQVLAEVRDMERLSTRIAGNRASPHDFSLLRGSLRVMPRIIEIVRGYTSEFFTSLGHGIDILEDVCTLLEDAFVEELPAKLGERDVIRDSYHKELARLRALRKDSQSLLTQMELEERQKTGIQNLKIKHNSVFGYFIEISKGQLAKVPDRYTRKQTLTNAERFVTPELKTLEQELLSSKTRLFDLERQLFLDIRAIVADASLRLQKLARSVAVLDVIFSFAYVSRKNSFVRPEIVEQARTEITGGRHPVVEMVCGRPDFVPNDACLDADAESFAVLTGPNMGGKSTYLRQVGIIQVLAQSGCFVPAKKAVIGIADRIFTRIGSGDALAKGESTFMVEMKEAANIIRNATSRSLVLIDEVGRGTATTDGLALATAIAHWLIDTTRCRTVFATHFHELTALPEYSDRVFCLSVGIVETSRNIEFTHRIEHKVSTKSYGLHVARLAGVPDSLINEASRLLSVDQGAVPVQGAENIPSGNSPIDSNAIPSDLYALLNQIKTLQPETVTPLQALELLYEFAAKVKKSDF
jgi:DNA mismatch repair protein MutS